MTKRKRKIKTMTLDPVIYQRFRHKMNAMGTNVSRDVESYMKRMLEG